METDIKMTQSTEIDTHKFKFVLVNVFKNLKVKIDAMNKMILNHSKEVEIQKINRNNRDQK